MKMISTMMNKRILLTLGLLALTMAACQGDPRKQAEANAISSEANARAAAEKQRLEQEAEVHEMNMQDRKAAQAEFQAAVNNVIAFGQFVVMALVLGIGVMGVRMTVTTTKAYSVYAHRRAQIAGDIIKLDPATHTFPILPVRVGENMIALVNPNDNSVIFFDKTNPADLAKVKAMANVLFAGELGKHARLSHKPGEVASIPAAQIIDGE